MSSTNKIPYDDSANYAAESDNAHEYDFVSCEEISLPQSWQIQRHAYEGYIKNHAVVITSAMPIFLGQEKLMSQLEFETLKQRVIERCKEIPDLNDATYFESITLLALHPIQLYSYVDHEKVLEALGKMEQKLLQFDFYKIKKNILLGLIENKIWWPKSKEHHELLRKIFPKYYESFYNLEYRNARAQTAESDEDKSIAFLKQQLKNFEAEKKWYTRRSLEDIDADIALVQKALNDLEG